MQACKPGSVSPDKSGVLIICLVLTSQSGSISLPTLMVPMLSGR